MAVVSDDSLTVKQTNKTAVSANFCHNGKPVTVAESSPFVVQTASGKGIELSVDDEEIHEARLPARTIPINDNMVQAIGEFKTQENGDLSFKSGEILQVLDSSRDDGWFMAENALGERGMIPGNHVKKIGMPISLLTETDPVAEKTKHKSGKQLWKTLRSNVKKPSLSDVLSAFGALPSGFRNSSLKQLLDDESNEYLTSTSIYPRLSMTGVAFKDLKWDSTSNQVQSESAIVNREIILISAKMIPVPSKDMTVLSRHLRIALYNQHEVISNIHTVKATVNQQDEKTWHFLPKQLTMNSTLYHRKILLRYNANNIKTELLFELCVILKKKSGQVKEFSSGWSTIPLFDDNNMQLTNKTYELKVNGGTPHEHGIELDPAQNLHVTGGRLASLLRINKTPRLYIEMVGHSSDAKRYSNFLPKKMVTSQQYIKAIACFRQLVGESFLSNTKGLPLPTLVHRPALKLFIKAIDQHDLMDYTLKMWQKRIQNSKRSEKNSLASISKLMERVLLEHTCTVMCSTLLPRPLWDNPEREKERELVFKKFSEDEGNYSLLSSSSCPSPLSVEEQIFKVHL